MWPLGVCFALKQRSPGQSASGRQLHGLGLSTAVPTCLQHLVSGAADKGALSSPCRALSLSCCLSAQAIRRGELPSCLHAGDLGPPSLVGASPSQGKGSPIIRAPWMDLPFHPEVMKLWRPRGPWPHAALLR